MAATIDVQEGNGAGPAWNTVTAPRFNANDVYNPGTSDPCVIGGSMNYSYWKHHCLLIGGTFTTINNVQWFCDGTIAWTLGTSGGLYVAQRDAGDHGCPAASYDQASGTPGTTGDECKANHTYYSGEAAAMLIATTFVTGSRMDVDTGDHTVAEKTKGIVYQLRIDTDATAGAQAAETFTFAYDEV